MQEAYCMKKITGVILILCLVLVLAVDAFAAGKPAFTKQPVTSTTNKKGTVSFSVKTSGTIQSLTWYFIDPDTGSTYSGKQLAKAYKGLGVTGPNSKKITLKKVPESLHGWTVYCHINGNGYKIDSDRVQLLVYGLEPPAQGVVEADKTDDSKSSGDSARETAGNEGGDSIDDESAGNSSADNSFTVSCSSKLLRKLDASGNPVEGDPSSSLQFTDTGSFIVTSEDPIKSWSVNGIRFEPTEPVNEFKVLNVTGSMSLNVKINRATAASMQVDESHMCHVTCNGCTFSYIRGQLISVTSGDVPAGAAISVVADSTELAANGYRINGAEPDKIGMTAFQLIVTDDVEISTK